MKYRIIVSAVIEKNGKILLGKKFPGVGPYPDKWLIPGGGVRLEEETLREGLERELMEETGLEIESMENLGFDADFVYKNDEKFYYIFLQFKVVPKTVKAAAGDDLEIVKWFAKSELKRVDLSNPTIKLFKRLGFI